MQNNELIMNFMDNVYKTSDELNNVPLPELYKIPLDEFLNNEVVQVYGFRGMCGFEVITPKQTVLNTMPYSFGARHCFLAYQVYTNIYGSSKKKLYEGLLEEGFFKAKIPTENINNIVIRHLSRISTQDNQLNASNVCVIYGNLDNINSYQKKQFLESIKCMLKKDPSIQICHIKGLNNYQDLTIQDIIDIVPNDNIVLDDEEKIISSKETNFVGDVSNIYDDFDYSEIYYTRIALKGETKDLICPIIKFKGYEKFEEYFGRKPLTAPELNKIMLGRARYAPVGLITDPDLDAFSKMSQSSTEGISKK